MRRTNLYESFGYKNPKPKVGDKVKVLHTNTTNKNLIGLNGVVEYVLESENQSIINVKFDNQPTNTVRLVLESGDVTTQSCDMVKICGDMGNYSVRDYSDFVDFVEDELDMEYPVKVKLENEPTSNYTTGNYNRVNREIKVRNNGRKLVDIIRSIAHEMVHHKQDDLGKIKGKVPKIGGEVEDEANKISGRLVKKYGNINPNIYE